MGYVIFYTPAYLEKDSKGKERGFMVNGATSKEKEESIRLGNKHSSVKDGTAKLHYVEETKVWEDD